MMHLGVRNLRCGARLLRSGARQVCRCAASPTSVASTSSTAAVAQRPRLASDVVLDERHTLLDTLRLYEQPALYDAAFTERQFGNEVHLSALRLCSVMHERSLAVDFHAMTTRSSVILQVDFLLDVAKQHAGQLPQSFLELGCDGCSILLCHCEAPFTCLLRRMLMAHRCLLRFASWRTMLQMRPGTALAATGCPGAARRGCGQLSRHDRARQ